MGFLLAWLSTWLAVSRAAQLTSRASLTLSSLLSTQLWSLAVAVCLPRSNGRRHTGPLAFFSSPAFINTHFLGGIVLCSVSIIIPSVICSNYYDAGINHFRTAYAMLGGYAPSYEGMSSAEVDTALAEVIPVVDGMLGNLSIFPYSFGVSWACWLAWIIYSYGVSLLSPALLFALAGVARRRTT